MTEPLKCRKGDCAIVTRDALFSGYYIYCAKCKNSSGIEETRDYAIATWNRWLMDDPHRKPLEEES